MKFVFRLAGFVAALTLTVALPAAAQDLTIVSKVSTDGKPPETKTSYLSHDHIRMSHGEGRETIFDLVGGQMTTLDGTKKTYYVVTKQDMDQLAARMKEQMDSPEMRKAQEATKNLSKEDREKMDAAMGGMFQFDVHKTGTSRKIAGYACEDWTVTMGQMSRTDECLTSELQFPAQAWDMYRGFAQSMQTMMAVLGPMAKSITKMTEQFKKMRGYPLSTTTTISVMGHNTRTSSEVIEIKRGPIPASAWEIPAGYTKVESPMMRALQPRHRR